MSYRDIHKDRILKFPATAGFKGWKDYFTPESIAHPAKMNLNLLRWILKTYTKPGDVVLDPMAGTGSMIILASLLGRHGIAVEYEPKFCDMIRENIKRTERHTTFTPKGRMTCIQGDARELSKLLEKPDAIVTSPPYASPGGAILDRAFMEKLALDPTSKRYGRKTFPGYGKYSENPEQIGNKPYGRLETIITSPPYSLSETETGNEKGKRGGDSRLRVKKDYAGVSEGNLAKLKHGDIEAIVTSPPYGNRLSDETVQDGDEARVSYRQAIDSIMTSPPSEITISSKIGGPMNPQEKRSLKLMREYSDDSNNIGNLKSDSYLEAMLQVYRECHKVLKPKGIMILVTKNFIRNKKVIRLDEDTIKLCEAAGFTLKDRWYFKLPQKSFWRILYSKRFPDVPEVEYEDVLIFTK